MRLIDLINGDGSGLHLEPTLKDLTITGLSADSRAVRPGYLFAALPGSHADGRSFIPDAVARGAVAVLAPRGTAAPAGRGGVAFLTDDNPRRRLALMAARFHPGQPATIAAVTGTNGKTSVAAFTRQLWAALGRPAASLGTLGLVAPGIEREQNLTTPDPVALHRILDRLARDGVGRAVIEASSHGLDQYRLDGVRVRLGAFTNLSRDHLDYHGTPAAYLAAKTRLFDSVMAAGGAAVLNADVLEFAALRRICRDRGHRITSYGRAGADIELAASQPLPAGQRLSLVVAGRRHIIDLPLVGEFQAMNALCALGLVLADGAEPAAAVAALARLEGVRGRMQRVARLASGAAVYVDYAHTPDALRATLAALRPHCDRNLVVVFGCGGERDRGKRPEMGRIAARLADRVVVTDDNPRGEDAAAIRGQIMAACPGAREIGDRAQAIEAAIAGLGPGDILAVAGKGHERTQVIGGRETAFDDARVAAGIVAALEEKGR